MFRSGSLVKATFAIALLAPALLSGCVGDLVDVPAVESAQLEIPTGEGGADDAVVIAVVDFGVNPYHLDWRADLLPQHLDDDPSNDIPLDRPPHEWLPGFPGPDAFATYDALNLTLPDDPEADAQALLDEDADEWDRVEQSDENRVHYYHVPGTKVIGLVDFASSDIGRTSGAHGARAASVSTGNLYGSCPECLLVFVNSGGEESLEWALRQPWIDAVTNSYGYSLLIRDRLYSGSDVDLSRTASERGQTVFFSAGNGQANTFTAPNPTLFSSQEGPDWMITVGAVGPDDGGSYSGHGKPADVASVGSRYPSQGGPTVSSEGSFGGTSSATPTIAGTYARALWVARANLEGPSRVQENGTIAQGAPFPCGAARPGCELADGMLTAAELRTRVLQGAVHTGAGVKPSFSPASTPAVTELEFLSEGHGTYFARLFGDGFWLTEFRRILDPLLGEAPPLERPRGEEEWMVVDSYCRQHLWGAWSGGYYVDGETPLPEPSPAWPLRSSYQSSCDSLFPPVRGHAHAEAPVTLAP